MKIIVKKDFFIEKNDLVKCNFDYINQLDFLFVREKKSVKGLKRLLIMVIQKKLFIYFCDYFFYYYLYILLLKIGGIEYKYKDKYF